MERRKLMRPRRNSTVTSLILAFVLLIAVPVLGGEIAGTVTHVSGPLFALKGDGTRKALSTKSAVEQGDTLVTEKRTYARIKFIDNSEVTLRPGSQLVVEKFFYDKNKPEKDSAVFNLVKGGLRAVSGKVGKRGDKDSYKMNTLSATIGIRGTHYGASHCTNDCGKLPSGLYVDVAAGSIVVSNQGGQKVFDAGQFGYVRDSGSAPITLPKDPGITFNPPPSIPPPASKAAPAAPAKVDCEVR